MRRYGLLCLAAATLVAGCESAPEEAAIMASPSRAVGMAAPAPAARAGHILPGAAMPLHMVPAPGANDRFTEFESNRWIAVDEQPVSTFSADVDTASYAFVRRSLREGRLPPVEAVRVEEMVNYFPYAYPLPDRAGEPFKATVTVAPSPWTDGAKLVHIGVKGFDVARTARPRANLTFLIDTSGSMGPPDRLPLIKQAMNQLREGLHPDDSIAIVTYAGDARVALEPTKGSDIAKIEAAVQSLGAAGGTHGAAGIHTAYQLAEQMFDKEAVNRVILATDGDFNIGETNPKRLEEIVASKRKTGIYLTVLGVGIGNLNDGLMQRLAQTGNGQAAYLDSLLEARKVWVEQLGSTMFPIADDVKLQVEFNPAQVGEYRLVGYETRKLKRADFNDDRVDAGEIGSGHSVTAIYEVMPAASAKRRIDPLRYGKAAKAVAKAEELGFLRMRYKLPGGTDSRLVERPIMATEGLPSLDAAPEDMRFAVAVAGFAQLLRNDPAVGKWSFDQTAQLAEAARGSDPFGWRAEFVQLARTAKSMKR